MSKEGDSATSRGSTPAPPNGAQAPQPSPSPLSIPPQTDGIDADWSDGDGADSANVKPPPPPAPGRPSTEPAVTTEQPDGRKGSESPPAPKGEVKASIPIELGPTESDTSVEPLQQPEAAPPSLRGRDQSAAPEATRRLVACGAGLFVVLALIAWVVTRALGTAPRSAATPAPLQASEGELRPAPQAAVSTHGTPFPTGLPSTSAETTEPTGSAQEAASVAPTSSTVDTVKVLVKIRPEGARVYRKGKEVGRSPFTLEVPRGERRAFEVGYPGYTTRKFVVDGSEPVISFAMIPKR